ncbi:serine/threonine-protein kinase HT1 [Canna indica]|uniref:non-specific serine/threonine protein kinase n=1 Tax=Canna indica TaxID=4628 RepID=A0AAQ3QI71_9LILI|nr:serine/threonine-protein kinase HT1 [Canna indica]
MSSETGGKGKEKSQEEGGYASFSARANPFVYPEMAFCFPALKLGKKNRANSITLPSSPPATLPSYSSPSSSSRWPKRNSLPSEMEVMEKKRWDSLESWSMLLDPGNADVNSEANTTGERSEEWMADLSQLFIGNKFASGSNSRIYRGIYKQRAAAVKMVRIPEQDEEMRAMLEKQFNSEVAFLSRLYHPNIVQFIAACKKPPVYCIITEYMSQGTLRMYLHKKEPYSLSTETILRLALDISRGMQYLHSQGVIHRDLKSHNLLLNDEMRVKVADFGTSCLETQCRKSKGNMGTYRWMAPEMIKEKPYTRKVDVYSFGIVLWELTTALVPYQGMTPMQAAYAASEKNLRPPLSTTCSPVLNNLIKSCWSANPAKRPDFNYIVSVLEKYDECLREGFPVLVQQELRIGRSLFKLFKGCIATTSSTARRGLKWCFDSVEIKPKFLFRHIIGNKFIDGLHQASRSEWHPLSDHAEIWTVSIRLYFIDYDRWKFYCFWVSSADLCSDEFHLVERSGYHPGYDRTKFCSQTMYLLSTIYCSSLVDDFREPSSPKKTSNLFFKVPLLNRVRGLFSSCHFEKGSKSYAVIRAKQDKFKTLALESDSSTPTIEDEIYRQAVGPERHGRTRGYGIGPTPTTVFGTTTRRIELASELRIANTQNVELKTKIDELEKKIDDDRWRS